MARTIASGIVISPTESDVRSAIHPVTATPIPPTPTASPSISPETSPTLPGAISWAMATVTAKVDQRMNPEDDHGDQGYDAPGREEDHKRRDGGDEADERTLFAAVAV